MKKHAKCARGIVKAKKQFVFKMKNKPEDVNTIPKTDWTITVHWLYNKKILEKPSLLVDGNFVSDFYKKAYFFNMFCINMYIHNKCNYSAMFFMQDKQ